MRLRACAREARVCRKRGRSEGRLSADPWWTPSATFTCSKSCPISLISRNMQSIIAQQKVVISAKAPVAARRSAAAAAVRPAAKSSFVSTQAFSANVAKRAVGGKGFRQVTCMAKKSVGDLTEADLKDKVRLGTPCPVAVMCWTHPCRRSLRAILADPGVPTALHAKVVFVRADLNVPLDKALEITDDTRIRAAIPTLEYLTAKGAKVMLSSHLVRKRILYRSHPGHQAPS